MNVVYNIFIKEKLDVSKNCQILGYKSHQNDKDFVFLKNCLHRQKILPNFKLVVRNGSEVCCYSSKSTDKKLNKLNIHARIQQEKLLIIKISTHNFPREGSH